MGRTRYINAKCENPDCKRFGEPWSHPQIGTLNNGQRILACDDCREQMTIGPAAPVPKKKTTWPYYHEGCGVTFESESHEQKYTKAHGMTKE